MVRVVCPVCKAGFEARITRDNCAINCVTCGVAFNASSFLPKAGKVEKFERYTGPVLVDPPKFSASKLTDTTTAGLPFPALEPFENNSAVATLEAPRPKKNPDPVPLPKLPKQEPRQEPRPQGRGAVPPSPVGGEGPGVRGKVLASDAQSQASGKSLRLIQEPPVLKQPPVLKDSESILRIVNPRNGVASEVPLTASARIESLMTSLETNPGASVNSSIVNPSIVNPSIPSVAVPPSPLEAAGSGVRGRDELPQEPRPQGSGTPPEPRAPGNVVTPARKSLRRPLLEGAFGKYEIEGEIARGGVGAVFRARDRATGKPFALKVLIEGDDVGETERERFRHECETAKALSLPGMVHIHDVGTHDGRPYMAMELVEGKSLDKVIGERSLTVNDCLIMMKSVANTVGALHEAGYVHRDLKPGNILLDAFGTPKVADFGLVKSLDEVTRMTASGLVCGTPAYMSPEQARGEGKHVDPRSDVWALGAVLYEMLAGEPPFKADNALKLMLRITKENPRKLTMANRKVPRDVEAVVNKCLEKNPSRRYPNGRALAADINTFLEGGKLELTTQSRMKQLMTAAKANRARIIPTTAAVIAIVVVGIVARSMFNTRSAAPLVEQGIAALKDNPQNDDKKLQVAQRYFQDALALEPKNGQAYLGLGASLARRGIDKNTHRILNAKFVEEAFKANDYAAKLEPKLEIDSIANAANYYTWLGRNLQAAAYWERLVRANPSELDFRNKLAMAWWYAGVETHDPKYYQRAYTEYKTIAAARPDYPKVRDHIQNLERNYLAANGNAPAVGMVGQR